MRTSHLMSGPCQVRPSISARRSTPARFAKARRSAPASTTSACATASPRAAAAAAAIAAGAARSAAAAAPVVRVILRSLRAFGARARITIQLIHRAVGAAGRGAIDRPIRGRGSIGWRGTIAGLVWRVVPSAVLVLLPGAVLAAVGVAVLAGVDVAVAARGHPAAFRTATRDGAPLIGPDRARRGAGAIVRVPVGLRPGVAPLVRR